MSDQWNVETSWRRLTDWLKANAPVSYASLPRPAPEQVVEAADAQLRQHLDFSLPAEPGDLWRLCGGVEHQYVEANEGEVGSGAFLPSGILLAPADALGARLPETGRGHRGVVETR
ncbi:hypothetical protein ACFXOY_01205 [Streptomyces niveus]|uniref:hypothetical protein n=1 Tax=Streptomyces niveus TaxID=193462 RepID=UPI00368536B8